MGELPDPPWRTRFAPAPTGALHLGHAVNALFVWGLARAHGGRVALRIEDHDRTRSRPRYEAGILEDLEWLGLEPDDGRPDALRAGPSPWRQSDGEERYAAALDDLAARGLVYVCRCSRRRIAGVTGPAAPGEELRYPGLCRDAAVSPAASPRRRIRLEREEIRFDDLLLGPQAQVPAEQCGDLLARDSAGCWTYQLAVVVDDLAQGIDVVIRGTDLLDSTGRQIQLGRLLGRRQPPMFLHHPLVCHPDGSKLSKANRDTGLAELRAGGWSPERVLGEAAWRAGLLAAPTALRVADLPDLTAEALRRRQLVGKEGPLAG